MPTYFTLEQANAALKLLRPLVRSVMEQYQELITRQAGTMRGLQASGGNGGNQEASQAAFILSEIEALVSQIQATGALVKDLETGLLDFPAWRDGREVYLCWRYGEETVAYWHEVDAGFAGRKPL